MYSKCLVKEFSTGKVRNAYFDNNCGIGDDLCFYVLDDIVDPNKLPDIISTSLVSEFTDAIGGSFGFWYGKDKYEEVADNKMKIRIKYFDDAKRMQKIDKGNWIDVYANKDMFIPEGHRAMIPLGFALELPAGFEGHLAPRSSTFKTWGIIQTNSVGVVDDTYIGDNDQWHMPVYCLMGKDEMREVTGTMIKGTYIHKGDKIGQFRIMEVQPEFDLVEVESFGNADRGGFGSTGSK